MRLTLRKCVNQVVLVIAGIRSVFQYLPVSYKFQVFSDCTPVSPYQRVIPANDRSNFRHQHIEAVQLTDVYLFVVENSRKLVCLVAGRVHIDMLPEGKRTDGICCLPVAEGEPARRMRTPVYSP